ncbi:hypothetical protein AAEX37_00290 [Oligella sp. MSHR50489EDL]|uniref:prepilin peptidase n=1 Tax=Oligella sp. MSHR50489EDL TaxID=3139409 RepID=UPI003D81B6C2
MFQRFFFLAVIAGLLYLFLPRYLLSLYRCYRGDPYWQEVRPYKQRYAAAWAPLLFLMCTAPLLGVKQAHLFYLLFSAFLISLAWLDLKLRILPDLLLLLFALLGLAYSYFVIDSIILLRLAIVVLWVGCAKIVQVLSGKLVNCPSSTGLGSGDIKFIAALACWFDMPQWLFLVALACAIALIVIVLKALLFKRRAGAIAFGPYLSLAAWLLWWWPSLYS